MPKEHILPDRRERETLTTRRGLVQDLRMYGGQKTVMRFFNYLRMRGMVDEETAAAVEKDLQELAGKRCRV